MELIDVGANLCHESFASDIEDGPQDGDGGGLRAAVEPRAGLHAG